MIILKIKLPEEALDLAELEQETAEEMLALIARSLVEQDMEHIITVEVMVV